jgi:surfeit locus 1 family protein
MTAASESATSPDKRRTWRGLLAPAVIAFAVLIGLGTWQLQRKTWKEGSIASLTVRLDAPAQALPAASGWPNLDQAEDDYRRVAFTAEFLNDKEALVFASATGFRPDVTGTGYWVFTPVKLSDGSVVMVNRGFVPDTKRDAKSRPDGALTGAVKITGVMRWPDDRHWFTPNDDPAHNVWFSRDPASIAAAKGLAAVAPFYVEQDEPAPPGGLPQPGKLVVSLPDNHLQYAVTWYGLAAVLLGVFVAWIVSSRRAEVAGEGAEPVS